MIAYKFLRPERVGPFSGMQWPAPGVWLESEAVEACRAGIHACRLGDLPFWLGLGDLWETELDGQIEEDARSGKLDASYERLHAENRNEPDVPLDDFLDEEKLS